MSPRRKGSVVLSGAHRAAGLNSRQRENPRGFARRGVVCWHVQWPEGDFWPGKPSCAMRWWRVPTHGEEKCSGGEKRRGESLGAIAAGREGGAGWSDSPRGDPAANERP